MRITPFIVFIFTSFVSFGQTDTTHHTGTIRIRKVNSVNSGDTIQKKFDKINDLVNQKWEDSINHNQGPREKKEVHTYVTVENEYAVYRSVSEAPKLGKIKGSQKKYIKSKDLRSFGLNEENPIPIGGRNLTDQTEVPFTDNRTSFTDTIWDISKYISDTLHYTFDAKDAPRSDTIQLKIVIDKKGKYKYTFVSRQDSLSKAGAKCMEALTTIRKWQPAHVYTVKDGPSKGRQKKKSAYAELLMTIVLSTESPEDPQVTTDK